MPSWSVTLGSRVSKRFLLIWYVTHSKRLLSTVQSYKKEGILTCFPALSDSKMSLGYIANIFTCYQGFYSFSCKLNVFGIRRPFDGFFLLLAILSHYLSPFRSDSGYWQIVEETQQRIGYYVRWRPSNQGKGSVTLRASCSENRDKLWPLLAIVSLLRLNKL